MTTAVWEFSHTSSSSVYTVLQNVQSFSFTEGKTGIQEPLKAKTGTITGFNPSALPTIEVGDAINIRLDGTDYAFFAVADFVVDYGLLSSMDTWTITLEGAFAQAGRVTTSCTIPAGVDTYNATYYATVGTGINVDFYIGQPPAVETVSGQVIENESVLNILQRIINTEQGGLSEGGAYGLMGWISQTQKPNTPQYLFTDGTVGSPLSSDIQYDNLQFAGIAQNYFTEVVVSPVGGTEQTVGTAGRTLFLETYSDTDQDALDIGGYALATVNSRARVPYQISCIYERQANNNLRYIGLNTLQRIILRGSTYLVYVTGRTVTSTPNETRFTFDLVDGQSVGFFTLDNTYFGILDQNKLS